MAASSRPCSIKKCEISSCAVCHCCQHDLCLDHLKEHKDQLNTQLTPLANQINVLFDDLEHFTPESLPSFQVLEQWRIAAHETVERFYERVQHELFEQKKNTPMGKLKVIRNTLDQLIQKQGATRENINSLTDGIRLIGEEIYGLRNIQINLQPLVIDDKTIIQSNPSNRQSQQKSVEPKRLAEENGSNNRPNENVFQVFVQARSGESMLITIKPTDTIMDLKRKIQERNNYPIEVQRLTYMGKTLQDEHRLNVYDFQRLSTINLNLASRVVQNEQEN